MSSSGSGGSTNARPGIFSSHRGKKAKMGIIVASVASVGLFIGSGFANDEEDEGEQELDRDQQIQAEADAQNTPSVGYAPANAFDVEREITLPDNFVQSSERDYIQEISEEIAITYSTYSSRQTPEDFIASVPAIEIISDELLEQAEESWPEIEEEGISVEATSTDIDPAIRGYDEEFMTVTMEVTLVQTAVWPDGEQTQHSRAVTMTLGHEESPYVSPSLQEIEDDEEDEDTESEEETDPDDETEIDAEWYVISLSAEG